MADTIKKENRLCPVCNRSYDRCKCDPEKDWGLKVGSKEEVAWKKIAKDAEETINKSKRDIDLLTVIKAHAEKRMKEEHEKFIKENP